MKKVAVWTICIVILLIPIGVLAYNRFGIPLVNYSRLEEETIESTSKERDEFNDKVEKGEIEEVRVNEDKELTERLNKSYEENEREKEYIGSIISRFYEEDFLKLQEEINSEEGLQYVKKEISEDSPEAKMFTLFLDVIEKKDITKEEKKLLINYVKESKDDFRYTNASKLKNRLDRVCGK